MIQPATIQEADDFEDTPLGWGSRWQAELAAAREYTKKWHATGRKVHAVFRDEREAEHEGTTRWNLFTANILTQQALLYGNTPTVTVTRKFADSADDVARVSSEILERALNSDVERDGDSYAEALQYALEDFLLPGLGQARVRYVAEFEQTEGREAIVAQDGRVLAEAVAASTRKVYECVETDYVRWEDYLWSPAGVWHEVRWVAFKSELSKTQIRKRFDEQPTADGQTLAEARGFAVADTIPYNATRPGEDKAKSGKTDPWARASVWEIWDKDSRRVFWYVEGYPNVLDQKDDPLGLTGFFPCPKPMAANTTTSTTIPRPDYVLAEDLYREINELSTRIRLLTKAMRVAGVYDKSAGAIQRLLSEASENELIPVDNWGMFAEKGGIRGQIDWIPLEQIASAIQALDARREVAKSALYEVTGMSDLLRGQAVVAGASATEQSIKARFASVRLQRRQDEFARFASDIQRLKAEVMVKHYDTATLLAQSNIELTPDNGLALPAVELLRNRYALYRVKVKPEAVAMQDFGKLQSDRMSVIGGLSTFMSAAAPVAGQLPGSLPFLLEVLKWVLAGLPGGSDIEGVMDSAIEQAQQMAQQPQGQRPQQPDPKLAVQQLKGTQEMAKIQAESQADLMRLNAEVQADAQRERTQREENVREAAQKAMIGAQTRASNGDPFTRG